MWRWAGLGVTAILSAALPATAQQTYPERPIHVMVGFPAGSGADIGVRVLAERLQDVSKQKVIVENKPGAGSNIAIGLVTKARPDGYMVLMAASSAMAGSRFIYKDFKIDTETELTPAAMLWRSTFILTVAPASPINSVAELTNLLKTKPRTLHGFSNQTGQLAAAAYLANVGATSNPVSYRGAAEAVGDLNSGTLDFVMLDGAFASGQFRDGRIKPLGVSTTQRSSAMPEVPTMQEAGVAGFEFAPFWAAYVPKGTPQPIVDTLTGWFHQVIEHEITRERFKSTGSIPVPGGPDMVRAALKFEIVKWAGWVKAAGIEPQ